MSPQDKIDVESAGAPRLKVLLVEDEVLIRMDVADSLRAAGWDVVEAGTVGDALTALKTESFDLVLTDVHLPGDLTGLDLARIVTQTSPEVKVVVMSGQHVPADDETIFFQAFLSKPVFDVAGTLRRLVESKNS
ncbi:response regulator [Phyllobacterium endophyticum]|nr:response regulator [Phyllobacterium endophyticum]MBB3237369.1 CheY-like chemotaxis protein [Phyllobacterium endophyticum]